MSESLLSLAGRIVRRLFETDKPVPLVVILANEREGEMWRREQENRRAAGRCTGCVLEGHTGLGRPRKDCPVHGR